MSVGVYTPPSAIVEDPDYARRLQEDASVTIFQLRTGFNPQTEDPGLSAAVECVRELGAQLWLLVGTWWGDGVETGPDTMHPVVSVSPSSPAHESRFPMRVPGGPADEEVRQSIASLLERYRPDGICLTHARYRHAADIPGLFEWRDGPFSDRMERFGIAPETLRAGWRDATARMQAVQLSELQGWCREQNAAGLLDALSESTVFSRWFDGRCRTIESSVQRLRNLVDGMEKDSEVVFGVNAMNPCTSYLAGQDYAALTNMVDFVQPLLGYVRWHVLQPIGAWALLLMEHRNDLSERDAIELAASLLGFRHETLPESIAELDAIGEGHDRLIEELIAPQIWTLARETEYSCKLYPVLRGRDWPPEVFERLRSYCNTPPFTGVFFQGTEHLTDAPGSMGWA